MLAVPPSATALIAHSEDFKIKTRAFRNHPDDFLCESFREAPIRQLSDQCRQADANASLVPLLQAQLNTPFLYADDRIALWTASRE